MSVPYNWETPVFSEAQLYLNQSSLGWLPHWAAGKREQSTVVDACHIGHLDVVCATLRERAINELVEYYAIGHPALRD